MDIDCPVVSLKRSSSAPMINEISATMSVSSPSTSAPRDAVSTLNLFSNTPRTRRFSTSSPGNAPRLTPRVNQLKQEECIDVAGREAAHEKEIHSAMQISQSWEDLTLEAEGLSFKDSDSSPVQQPLQNSRIERHLARRIFDPLNLSLSTTMNGGGPPLCSSPSPTRSSIGQRQCYSPGVHIANWKSNLSPSPTRKAFATRRSLSPIAIRPSCLGPVKRKFELDDNGIDQLLQRPVKRISSLVLSSPSRLDTSSSSSVPETNPTETPKSLSSIDSSSFSFQSVDSPSSNQPISNSNESTITQNNESLKSNISNTSDLRKVGQCNHR
ncbi:protein FAM122A [Chelonus insularis]|uniref:protein FAM122A n=1 Tax=Chelonus insularis TaxID=460826 RepID=UPI0015895CA4|nr:protein FAM122A [Chelonus insularis]XP_034945311.1 protein FAM122A [Chelonus insularis]